jgi:hypothetical protein
VPTPYVLTCVADCLYASGWIDLAAALCESQICSVTKEEVRLLARSDRVEAILSNEIHRRMIALVFGSRSCRILRPIEEVHADAQVRT